MSTEVAARPSRQKLQAQTASRPRRVTGKLAVACKRVVWEGEELDQAAKAAGLTTRTVRLALQRRHVIEWLKAEREVFRAYVASQNVHHARKMRAESGNEMAKLGAMKFLENMGDDEPPAGLRGRQPGCVIQILPSFRHLVEGRPGVAIVDVAPARPELDAHAEPVQSADLLDTAQD